MRAPRAGVAQLAERLLPKQKVEGSRPFSRSNPHRHPMTLRLSCRPARRRLPESRGGCGGSGVRRSIALAIALLLVLMVPAAAPAMAADGTPPVGSVRVVHDERANGLVRLNVTATDDLSGVTTVDVSSHGTTWASFPYPPEFYWPVFEPASGASPGQGRRTVR